MWMVALARWWAALPNQLVQLESLKMIKIGHFYLPNMPLAQ